MRITDRTLALFLVIAVFISLSLSLFSIAQFRIISTGITEHSDGITGYSIVNTTGIASVNISTITAVGFSINYVDFGNGSVNTTGNYNNCTMWINGSSAIHKTGCIGFNDNNPGATDSFIIENTGNINIVVSINSTGNASSFISGNVSIVKYQYVLSENETNSCLQGINTTLESWSDVVTSDTPLCANFSYLDDNDSLRLGILVTIPNDASVGNKNNTLIVTGTS